MLWWVVLIFPPIPECFDFAPLRCPEGETLKGWANAIIIQTPSRGWPRKGLGMIRLGGIGVDPTDCEKQFYEENLLACVCWDRLLANTWHFGERHASPLGNCDLPKCAPSLAWKQNQKSNKTDELNIRIRKMKTFLDIVIGTMCSQ